MSVLTFTSSTYTDYKGTYDIDKLCAWVNNNRAHLKVHIFQVKDFLEYLTSDAWRDPSEKPSLNLKHFEKGQEKARILEVDLEHPIVVNNFNKIIDGIHRLFKAIYEGHSTIRGIFIDQSTLDKFNLNRADELERMVSDRPIPDIFLRIPYDRLPQAEEERQFFIESYFSEHLPSVVKDEESWILRLERPQSCYGCYNYDPGLNKGLDWWKKNTLVNDIPAERRFLRNGIFAIEDQWIPLAWSRYFQRFHKIPEEIIVLHIDDHQDMMSPRVGRRADGELFDYITGDRLSLLEPSTVQSAILSGAIGKGSILTPLIWSTKKIHIRHLSFRNNPCPFYRLKKTVCQDKLFDDDNRISVQIEPIIQKDLFSESSYLVTSDVREWLVNLPEKIPILLHFDMDYFNNRYDGDSDWENGSNRKHETTTDIQVILIEKIIAVLKNKHLVSRIQDVSIGISAGFYPSEFWPTVIPVLFEKLEKIGLF